MSQKKPVNKSPIRITLTEDQISDIIQRAAKTRRNLSARSLEDRIAPSLVGGPMMDPGLMGGGPAGGTNPDFDGGLYPSDPHDIDPNLPEGPYDPTMPPLSDTQLEPPVPPEDNLPDNAPYDPNMPPVSDGMLPPPNPDGIPGFEEGGSNLPGGIPTGPGGHVPGSGHTPGSGGSLGGQTHFGGQMETLHGGHNPADGMPEVPTGDGVDPETGEPVDTTGENSGSTGTTPSSQELQEHRRNILRQLRGN
jgi:hypothetical protein